MNIEVVTIWEAEWDAPSTVDYYVIFRAKPRMTRGRRAERRRAESAARRNARRRKQRGGNLR